MPEHPIIFSAPMVQAILAGRKTQTRRIVTPANSTRNGGKNHVYDFDRAWVDRGYPSKDGGYHNHYLHVPYWHKNDGDDGASDRVRSRWESGDLLWVRENFYQFGGPIAYAADGAPNFKRRMTPSIHMPRWASRITLRVTDVRVQRLMDISDEDARAEGFKGWESTAEGPKMAVGDGFTIQQCGEYVSDSGAFLMFWDKLHGAGATYENPWVWVLTFERVQDQLSGDAK